MFGLLADHCLPNGHGWVEGVALVEHSDAQIVSMGNAAAIWLEGLRQNFHQRRFAIAVATDDSDSIAVVDADGHRFENFFRRKLQRDAFCAEHVCQVLNHAPNRLAELRGLGRELQLRCNRVRS